MPVDLSSAGLASQYPEHGPRFWPWVGVWVVCNVLGSALALLLWPKGEPARGAWFWFCVVGLPNCLFFLLLGIARAGYEAFWYRAHYRNLHRNKWLESRVRFARQPLHVLGTGYCLPLKRNCLAEVMKQSTSQLKMQALRVGAGTLLHNRFEEDSSLVDDPIDGLSLMDVGAANAASRPPRQIATIVTKLVEALGPLCVAIHSLSQYGSSHWPQVRVLAAPGEGALREQQVRDALRIAGLPLLECRAASAKDNLLVVDAWLDARERRPLLVIAVAWHDAEPFGGSTEACVAVLLSPDVCPLPKHLQVLGTLHRPVADDFSELESIFANAVIWGGAEASTVSRAWISGIDDAHDRTLLAALRAASLAGVATHEAQSRVDRVVGDAGPANSWLSVAAAIESGISGAQLIVDAAQAAILYVTPNASPVLSHDNFKE